MAINGGGSSSVVKSGMSKFPSKKLIAAVLTSGQRCNVETRISWARADASSEARVVGLYLEGSFCLVILQAESYQLLYIYAVLINRHHPEPRSTKRRPVKVKELRKPFAGGSSRRLSGLESSSGIR